MKRAKLLRGDSYVSMKDPAEVRMGLKSHLKCDIEKRTSAIFHQEIAGGCHAPIHYIMLVSDSPVLMKHAAQMFAAHAKISGHRLRGQVTIQMRGHIGGSFVSQAAAGWLGRARVLGESGGEG